MFDQKLNKFKYLIIPLFFNNVNLSAEEEEIYLKSISDQIQVITKDLKTLEKAVYQKSDVFHLHKKLSNNDNDEDILTKHLPN